MHRMRRTFPWLLGGMLVVLVQAVLAGVLLSANVRARDALAPQLNACVGQHCVELQTQGLAISERMATNRAILLGSCVVLLYLSALALAIRHDVGRAIQS